MITEDIIEEIKSRELDLSHYQYFIIEDAIRKVVKKND